MKLSTVFLIVTFALLLSLAHSNKNCEKLRNIFAQQAKEFERCTIQKAAPIEFCLGCIELYVSNLESFKNLVSTADENKPHVLCGDYFIDQDSLNIVQNQYLISRNLWNRGHCTNCFVPSCNPDKITSGDNITVLCQPNKDYDNIQSNINDLKECIQQSDQPRMDVCTQCLVKHNLLLDNLKRLQSSQNGVCFEIIDVVNRTGRYWYDDLKCARPPSSTTLSPWIFSLLLIPLCGITFGGYHLIRKYRSRTEYVPQLENSENYD